MEWPSKACKFRKDDFKHFCYEKRPSKVITLHLDDTLDLKDAFVEEELESQAQWEAWLDRVQTDAHDDEITTVHVILFRRTSVTILDCPPEIQYLPVSKSIFETITDSFHIHRSLARMFNRKDAEFLHCLQIDDTYEPERLVYNYRTSATFSNDIAVSVTHEPRFRSTMGIFFGLDDDQEDRLVKRMKDSLDDFHHPLAFIGAACELERDRWMQDHVRPMEAQYLRKTHQWSTSTSEDLVSDPEGEKMEDVLGLRFKSSLLLTGLKSAKRQLNRIGEHVRELRNDEQMISFLKGNRCWSDNDTKKSNNGETNLSKQQAHTSDRLQHRLNQISDEFEMKINGCHASMEDMMATTQVVISRLARHDNQVNMAISIATRRDNSQMRSIAFVTMIYLPLTSIATIFSMNVFNWNAKDGEQLMTAHFWLYLAVAGGSTILTVGLWIFYTGMRKGLFCKKDEEQALG